MEHSCGIVLFHENKVLLLKYKGGGHWDFPKGHIENNESETETALRELKEETGISEVTLFSDFREIIEYSFRKGRSTIKKQVIYFLGETEETNITLSHEHTNFLQVSSVDSSFFLLNNCVHLFFRNNVCIKR